MNILEKIDYMIEAVNRHNQKIYQENPLPSSPIEPAFSTEKNENIEDSEKRWKAYEEEEAVYEKEYAIYELKEKEILAKINKLTIKLPHILLITEQACLAEYLISYIVDGIDFNTLTGGQIDCIDWSIVDKKNCFALTNLTGNQLNKDSKLIDGLFEKSFLQIECIEDLKESLLTSLSHKFSLVASTSNYNNIDLSSKGMFFLVISGGNIRKLSEYYVRQLLENSELDFKPNIIYSIIQATEKYPLSLKALTNNIINFLRMKNKGQNTLTLDDISNYLNFSGISEKKTPQFNRSRQISSEVKIEVWRRDEGKCVMCSSQERLEYDHIIPFSKGGSNTARNIQLLCESCNRQKSAKIEF